VIELGRAVGMQLENDRVTGQCITEWAQKFALLLTFLALQELETGKDSMISEMTDDKIRQSMGF
jgi:hypothetical protein